MPNCCCLIHRGTLSRCPDCPRHVTVHITSYLGHSLPEPYLGDNEAQRAQREETFTIRVQKLRVS